MNGICRLIFRNVYDKNPSVNSGNMPSDIAARKGNLEIFKLISESVEDINPFNNKGETPLLLAAKKNHFHILKLSYCLKDNSHKRKMQNKPIQSFKKSKHD